MNSKFAKRINGVKQEKLNIRPGVYSEWHRTLGQEYLAVDVDFVEYRVTRGIVGLFSVTGEFNDERHLENSKKFVLERTKIERAALVELALNQGVIAYLVLYTNDLSVFHVWNLSESIEPIWTIFNKKEYENLIKNL